MVSDLEFDEKIENNAHEKSFWIEGYGCSASFADMEMIAGQLRQNGWKIANNPNSSTLNVIVTCSVKDVTEHRMAHRIKALSETGRPIIIAGCLPSADKKLVEKLNSKASLMSPNSINKTIEIANSTINGNRTINLENSKIEKVNLPRLKINPIISIVEIASGCLSECSFCQTKLAKGNLQSYRIGEIIKQIDYDLKTGVKEIWLTSTDNGCYGLDIGTDLVELLKKCEQISGNFWIRLGMMNPMYIKNMINGLAEQFQKSNKLFKFIHIPVQSGSEKVLKKMKRGHTAKTFREIVNQFREKIPNMTIATDVISGFPTETDDDFNLTIKLLQETEPDVINSSKFSSRPGTMAYKFKTVDKNIVSERSEKLHKVIKEIVRKRNSQWINWEGQVLIDEIENGKLKGRNQYHKSVIIEDFEYLEENSSKTNSYHNNNNIFYDNRLEKGNKFLGRTMMVKVIGISDFTLKGISIDN
ncbi:MAG: tRNA (N(6)-L-threonylcarbamoyladenosine(37)-C(2))-methylthiotransferase [Thermoproteota archaeon]|nr:tRNA (N(6)-L-threonylcarbamoyladenosine(37)-C(2))-methylthiotransferase [Thermoproteota archaeon]